MHIGKEILRYRTPICYLGVYCGNDDVLHPSCNLCPKKNDTILNGWCGGNCVYDKANQICKLGKS